MKGSATIAALATAPAPAGIAVVRVSGPDAARAVRAIFRSKRSPLEHPREMVLGQLIDYKTNHLIDRALAVYMPNPHSFTGEEVVEFQYHGSPLLTQKILRSLFAFGARPAEPGEFTKRAFLNGKLDLVQAEAISELINANAERALKVAGEHLSGKLSSAIDQIGEPLRDALAEIEASVDFPDEGIEPRAFSEIAQALSVAHERIRALSATYTYGNTLREGMRVLLCGMPNAGKSSLLNHLLGRKRAIVSEVPGTTRDLIEESLNLGGYHFVLCDSAGIRESSDTIEKIGVELALERVAWADLVLLVVDAEDTSDARKKVAALLQGKAKKIWMLTNKIDLNPAAYSSFFCDSSVCARNFYLSVKTGSGIQSLCEALIEEASAASISAADSSNVITSERHRDCLENAAGFVSSAQANLQQGNPPELASVDLRAALAELDEIVGMTYTEELLGRIFSKFCIGK